MLSRSEGDTDRIFVHKKDEVAGEICKSGVFIICNVVEGKQL
jgi:hypothetical protein